MHLNERVRRDISKEEAARRQIDRAVQMYFDDDDPICTHVVASAGWAIVRELCRKLEKLDALREMQQIIRQEKRKEVQDLISHPYNFFKHGDRDEDQLEHFDESQTEWILFMAVQDYRRAFTQSTPTMLVFSLWMISRHPDAMSIKGGQAEQLLQKLFPNLQRLEIEEAKAIGSRNIAELKALEFQIALLDPPEVLGGRIKLGPEAEALREAIATKRTQIAKDSAI